MTSAGPLESLIGEATGRAFRVSHRQAAGGGCINAAESVTGEDGRQFFVKRNATDRLAMFEAEADGLRQILASATLAAPQPVVTGLADGQACIVLEYLPLDGRGDDAELGRQLAAMHRVTQPRYGWWRDNSIGATPQDNTETADWAAFWRERRLGFQLALAARRQAPRRLLQLAEELADALPGFFAGHTPLASLLHGDLWGGNFGYCAGRPVIFDPAVYFGDREADLAMTELFGGFGDRFYAAYREAWPLDAGYPIRRDLYNLYHVLNHFNMFGGGYAGQAERLLARLLAECRA